MKIPASTWIAFAILPALSFARLRPHVIKRSLDINADLGSVTERSHVQFSENNADDTNCESHQTEKQRGHQQTHQKHVRQSSNNDGTNNGTTNTYVVPSTDPNHKKKAENYNAGIPDVPQTQPESTKSNNNPSPKSGATTGGGLVASNTHRPGFILGVAVRETQLDGSFDDCILPHSNLIVPENAFKMSSIHPQPKQYNFGPMDKIAKYAKDHDLKLKLHNFFWGQYNPAWLEALKGNKAGLEAAMEEHISTLMNRYGSDAVQIDVVNEYMEYSGSGNPNNDLFYSTLGDGYLKFAFDTTQKYNKHGVVPYLNDNDIEGMNYKTIPRKRAGLVNTLKKELAAGTKIGGIGMQGHFTAGQLPQDLGESMDGFIAMGFDVMITELDIKSNGDIAQQAKDYASVYETCIQRDGCKGVIRWDMDEDVSWEAGSKAELFGQKCASKGLDEGVKKVLRTGKA